MKMAEINARFHEYERRIKYLREQIIIHGNEIKSLREKESEAREQARIAWEREHEKDAAYQKALDERDAAREALQTIADDAGGGFNAVECAVEALNSCSTAGTEAARLQKAIENRGGDPDVWLHNDRITTGK